MKALTKIITILLLLPASISAQTITKEKAVRIAIKDKQTDIRQTDTPQLVKDSVTNASYWIVTEKLNADKELDKISQKFGTVYVYADRIKINADTGEIISREKIEAGKRHYMPDF